MNTLQPTLRQGIYRHYKGQLYLVNGIACHSETLEHMVVYRCLYGDYNMWVRPLHMFFEQVEHNGEMVNRFSFIKDANFSPYGK